MTALLMAFLLLAAPAITSLDQVKADPNPEHRARAAIDFALAAQKQVETAYASGDMVATTAGLKLVRESVELAQASFIASGKTPGRNTSPFKYAEQHTRQLLIRLNDLEQKMDASERDVVTAIKAEIQEIHDAWFEGIMGKKK